MLSTNGIITKHPLTNSGVTQQRWLKSNEKEMKMEKKLKKPFEKEV